MTGTASPSRPQASEGGAEPVCAEARAIRIPALGLVVALALLAVTSRISDLDVWQHLRVGQVLWQQHELPRTNVWTWPTFGAPYDLSSWLFCLVLWPFWAPLGERGLDLWRLVTVVGL